MRRRAHLNSHSSAGQCCRSTATVTAGTDTSSVCAEKFVTSITDIQVRVRRPKPEHSKGPLTEKSLEFVGPSDSRMKLSALDT